MKLINVAPDLYLLPLDQDLPGFTSFISAWIYRGKKTILVDVGPAATIPLLVRSLNELGVKRPDTILLTHIHIDHAGGIGEMAALFPDTPIVCHETGIRHLVDPSRLWEGSLKTLGKTAQAYGPFRPVPAECLNDASSISEQGVFPVMTPGHAPHHVSYFIDSCLFAGEAGGVFIQVPESDDYLRPATPPRLFFETYMNSVDKLIKAKPSMICYSHFGVHKDPVRMLNTHRKQLVLWRNIIEDEMARLHVIDDEDVVDNCLSRLLKEDSCLKHLSHMDRAVQEREKGFLKNSIKGFTGYLRDL
ncbi:MAG: MBL fold metallo-hydrolase [Desulfobacterales bacterium]|nr:MAG: MBL fold metallo-hydrolase [Desulfobacterales bacterium]